MNALDTIRRAPWHASSITLDATEARQLLADFEFTRKRLEHLRVSVVRVAQAAGVSLAPVRLDDNAQFAAISEAATPADARGFNSLCAEVCDVLDRHAREHAARLTQTGE